MQLDLIKTRALEGVALGIKWALVIIIVGLTLAWWVGDYQVTRARALAGQQAFEFLQQQQQQSQQRGAASAPPAKPAP